MANSYIKKYKTERLKIAINAAQKKHGSPLPLDVVVQLAGEFQVQSQWVRRTERRTDIDVGAYLQTVRRLRRDGIDADKVAGKKIAIGGAATKKNRKVAIRNRINEMLATGEGADLDKIKAEFGLSDRSRWPLNILCEIEKEQAGKGKRPVSSSQRDLLLKTLCEMTDEFTPELTNAALKLADRFSMAQVRKIFPMLYRAAQLRQIAKKGFYKNVAKPFFDLVEFRIFP